MPVTLGDMIAPDMSSTNPTRRRLIRFDPEDTIRWYALRLRETGLIKSSPQQTLTVGTDWRFLNELKRELKA